MANRGHAEIYAVSCRSYERHANRFETNATQIFVSHLPPVFPADYLQGWGQPGSALRLQKMAESIAAFARNAKRNESVDLADAITDWEDDLQYLYETYYVGHFHFAWPTSEVIWT
jgi:hypothetical protein